MFLFKCNVFAVIEKKITDDFAEVKYYVDLI